MVQYKLVTDSCCDLPLELLKEKDITMVPLVVNLEDKFYEDRIEMEPQEFYKIIGSSDIKPTTSQVNPGTFIEVFSQILDKGNKVLYIGFSSGLSGTYQSSVIAKETLESDDIITIDSKAASVGQGVIVLTAAKMLEENRPIEEIIEKIKYMVLHMEHIFAVDNMEMLKRGGRVSGAKALIGTMLNIKPVLNFVDGKIHPLDKVRGSKKILAFLEEKIKERGLNVQDQLLGISHAVNSELALEVDKMVREKFGVKETVISEIGAVIGSHAGPGTVALFFLGKDLQGGVKE
jgi:DegV family protein with EDD domain